MILKIIFTVIAVIVALTVLRVVNGRSTGSVMRDKARRTIAKRQRESAAMIRCPRCSAWHDPAEFCSCSSSSS